MRIAGDDGQTVLLGYGSNPKVPFWDGPTFERQCGLDLSVMFQSNLVRIEYGNERGLQESLNAGSGSIRGCGAVNALIEFGQNHPRNHALPESL
jgi:hypothetical protein